MEWFFDVEQESNRKKKEKILRSIYILYPTYKMIGFYIQKRVDERSEGLLIGIWIPLHRPPINLTKIDLESSLKWKPTFLKLGNSPHFAVDIIELQSSLGRFQKWEVSKPIDNWSKGPQWRCPMDNVHTIVSVSPVLEYNRLLKCIWFFHWIFDENRKCMHSTKAV